MGVAIRFESLGRMNVKGIFVGALVAAGAWLAFTTTGSTQTAAAPATGAADKEQHRISDQDLTLMRQDIRSKKKQLIAQNLKLTDTEATKFWPIYDQYTAELVKTNNKKYATIQEYADKFGTLTDEQATTLMRQWMEVDVSAAQLRAKYLPIVSQAIGGKKGATFAQLDRRVSLMIELQLASQVPLVQAQ
jgi:Spy/CpxP family protein refolding chaperone